MHIASSAGEAEWLSAFTVYRSVLGSTAKNRLGSRKKVRSFG
jgi:hypothetical protein